MTNYQWPFQSFFDSKNKVSTDHFICGNFVFGIFIADIFLIIDVINERIKCYSKSFFNEYCVVIHGFYIYLIYRHNLDLV